MYKIKTRNWNGSKKIMELLSLVKTKNSGYYSDDYDVKYWLETKNPVRAWLTWGYFMILRPFSGGWTYIIRPGKKLGAGYRTVY